MRRIAFGTSSIELLDQAILLSCHLYFRVLNYEFMQNGRCVGRENDDLPSNQCQNMYDIARLFASMILSYDNSPNIQNIQI